ncbi:IS6 family transposase [Streptomyces viridosporus ATCC 14672]|uniref:IS6 family transposase n=1 Tax=Streptomyces viridosporus (strain ATCC 14672 / DSM 40746 / JCM 4963 / KCTC 9882 / NRRL B-12104 / FH 1290) TaxID=566461 RepID=D6A771_STRV1|nr:IS6 family transposase [Streptomyces viridosporus ATCC 14672]
MAVLPFPARLSRGRGADARARCRRLPRDRPPLVREVRAGLRQRTASPPTSARGRRHLDEVFIKVGGELKYLWRAVDQDGNVLDILVRSRRDKTAAQRFFRRLPMTTRTAPRVVVTDKLRSHGAAHREVVPSVEHRSHKGLNNRAENSHRPTRQRGRAMRGLRSVGGARRFLSAFSGISPHFRPRRHPMTATDYRRNAPPLHRLEPDHRGRRPVCHPLSTKAGTPPHNALTHPYPAPHPTS